MIVKMKLKFIVKLLYYRNRSRSTLN